MKIAYLGPKGSFSHHVVQTAFPKEELHAFTDVIKAYEQGLVDYSVVPVENSIEGSVHESLDYLFHQARIQAVAEIVQPIHQQLMVIPGQSKIEKIFSHPQALAQGKKFNSQYCLCSSLYLGTSRPALCSHCTKKFCRRIWLGINCRGYSGDGSQFHTFLGIRGRDTDDSFELAS